MHNKNVHGTGEGGLELRLTQTPVSDSSVI